MSQKTTDEVAPMNAETAREILQLQAEVREQNEIKLLNAYCKKRGIILEPRIVLGPQGVLAGAVQIRLLVRQT